MQDASVELATSSDEEELASPLAVGLQDPFTVLDQSEAKDGAEVRLTAHRKRHRAAEVTDDPDQATSVRVRHNDHQQAEAAVPEPPSARPTTTASTEAVQDQPGASASTDRQLVPPPAPRMSAPLAAAAAAQCPPLHARPSLSQVTSANAPAASASSQQGDCIGPDGTFVGRAAAAGLPPNIMRQTRAALGLWEQLHETASTPSTVLAPVNRHAVRTVSVGTDNSAA